MLRIAPVTLMFLVAATSCAQSSFVVQKESLTDSLARSKFMAQLATDVMRGYEEPDRAKYLDTLFRLQLVAARFDEATTSIEKLRQIHIETDKSAQSGATDFQYEVYSEARKVESTTGLPFAEAFAEAFHRLLPPLDDRISAMVLREWTASLAPLQVALQESIDRQGSATSISRDDALLLLRRYQIAEAYRQMVPLPSELIDSEDQRRYFIQRDVLVKTPDGASICTMVVRPRGAKTPLTALLNFTIYADLRSLMNEARRTASNGYAGVEGLTRGKGCSPNEPVAYEHDGTDADILIDWITNQSWSDGRVGMFGGSYEGFTQWAAAKHLPKALQAMMPSVSAAPGLDVPMEGNIFQSFVYYWPFYAATGHGLDNVSLNDRDRWQRMQRNWYLSGKPYRDLDKIDGKPNPIFDGWLNHPSYDTYWQSIMPYRSDFTGINIPVLTTTGYYDGGQISALHYLSEHYFYNPKAEHYLIIGPYDHVCGQRGTVSLLGDAVTSVDGYPLGTVAQLDLGEIRYQWFEYVFKRGQKPAILQNRINYEVMGANEWRHVPSLAAMSGHGVEFHLSGRRAGEYLRLRRTADGSVIPFQLDLSDRTDVDRVSPSSGAIVDKHLDTWNSLAFISEPLSKPTQLSGLFQGQLDFICNKRDFDLEIDLTERTPGGEYFQLSSFKGRASYIKSQSVRQLLSPGAHEHLSFTSGRLTSRQLHVGSQVIVQIRIVKSPYAQINMGTGRDVSDESAADGKQPMRIRWFSTTSIKLPLSN
jgi:putative CocE/NonD family hydrolase